jgi:Flp pilus assembly protein TadB
MSSLEEGDEVPPVEAEQSRTSTAANERIAVVETKVTGLQSDLSRIGTHIHSISNEVTKISISEQKCLEGLASIRDTVESFEGKLATLIGDQNQRQGMGAFVQKFCLIVGACAAMVAVIAFLLAHVRFA